MANGIDLLYYRLPVKLFTSINSFTVDHRNVRLLQGIMIERKAQLAQVRELYNPTCVDEVEIVLSIFLNLESVNREIDALIGVSKLINFGDDEANVAACNRGFSLKRSLVAHGSECQPDHPDCFVLKPLEMESPLNLSVEESRQRLDLILKTFDLDAEQKMAFHASVLQLAAGISLVQGNVIAASSNTAVDQLSVKIIQALSLFDKQVQSWFGYFCARTNNKGPSLQSAR
ncbi:uncharacterized protein BJX67DRAFT_376121 [Aspergillus lucknowensis]|uniref:Apea-like HEPN domain-containing protein n=1 Tax=Aspergillus lucknowensis TaxID=176173 RepID=A0ABR4M6R7_9EURO